MYKAIIPIATLLLTTTVAYAQNASEIFRVSQVNYGFSTARSSAMGGAFTSLGADAASININPAGLGLYRSSEISFSPMLRINASKSQNIGPGSIVNNKTNATTFNVGNVSAIYNVIDEPKANVLRGLTLGISYNQLENFNSTQFSSGAPSDISIADMFSAQLYGIDYNSLEGTDSYPFKPFQTYPTSMWGAIEAYQTGLIFPTDQVQSNGKYYQRYSPSYIDGAGNAVGSLLQGDVVYPALQRVTTGGKGEYAISIGTNIKNIVYLGASLGIQDFRFSQNDYYTEATPNSNGGDLVELRYNQHLEMSGSAFSFKLGATVQPIKGLKLAVSVHAPTVFSISEEYTSGMSNFYLEGNYGSESAYAPNEYKVKTAPRLLTGISYTIGKRAILSFDYERTWYNNMRVTGLNYLPRDYTLTQELGDTYKAADIFKAGAEVNLGAGMFVRGGYAYYGNSNKFVDNKDGAVQNISGGIGYRNRLMFVDFTYVNVKRNEEPHRYFSYTFVDPADNSYTELYESNDYVKTKNMAHNLLLTVGFKF